jgi:hypothetical protein
MKQAAKADGPLPIVLAVLLALGGTITMLEERSALADGRSRRKVEEWSVSREGARELRLRNPGGNLRFLAGEENRIQVVAEKWVQGGDARETAEFLERMTLSRRREEDRWIFEADWPRPHSGWRGSAYVNWEVRLPRGMRLDAETGGGNVAAEDLDCARLHTGGGNLAVKRVDGSLDLHTGGGNVTVQQAAETRIHTGGGNVTLDEIRGPLRLETGGGNLRIERCSAEVDARTGGGNIEVRGAHGPIAARTGAGNIQVGLDSGGRPLMAELNTGAGNIELLLHGAANAQVRAATGKGRVSIEPDPGARVSGDRTHLDARLGDGVGNIRLNTGIGSVRIRLVER